VAVAKTKKSYITTQFLTSAQKAELSLKWADRTPYIGRPANARIRYCNSADMDNGCRQKLHIQNCAPYDVLFSHNTVRLAYHSALWHFKDIQGQCFLCHV